jgi:hypothetical protein
MRHHETAARFGRGALALTLLLIAAAAMAAPPEVRSRLHLQSALSWAMAVTFLAELPRMRPFLRMTPRQIQSSRIEAAQQGQPRLFTPLEIVAFWMALVASVVCSFT